MPRQAKPSGALGPLAVNIRRARARVGLTQEELADKARMKRSVVANIERGATRWPHPATLEKLAAAVSLTVEQLLSGNFPDEPVGQPAGPRPPVPSQSPASLQDFLTQYGQYLSEAERYYLEHSHFVPASGVRMDATFWWEQWQVIKQLIQRLGLTAPPKGK